MTSRPIVKKKKAAKKKKKASSVKLTVKRIVLTGYSEKRKEIKKMNCWELAETAVKVARAPRVLLHGAKGLAKSRWAQDTLLATHTSISQCTLNEDIAVQELLGHYIPKGDKFQWHDGPITAAYRGGHGLVINEVGRASGAVQDMMLAVLDDPTVSMIALASGENIVPGKSFQVVCTSNSKPDALDEALHDRFDAIIEITHPHPGLIDHLNASMDGLGTVIARSYQDSARTISPRRALAFISFMTSGVEEQTAALLAFGKTAKDVLAALRTIPRTAKAGAI